MKKITLSVAILLSFGITFANNINNLTEKLTAIYYQQNYCKESTPINSINFLKQNTAYSTNYCSDNSYWPGGKSKAYDSLVKEADSNLKKYGYLVAIANIRSIGTYGSNEIAEKWLQKSIKAGSEKAKIVYALLLTTHLTKNCNTVKKSYQCDAKARELLENVDFKEADTMLTAFYPGSEKLTCKIVTRAVDNGMLNSYPVYIACMTDGFKKPLTDEMKLKLEQVISNKETSITAKLQAAKILGDKKIYNLLKAIQ